jgi:Kef-type K+ transport system membrane component KefB
MDTGVLFVLGISVFGGILGAWLFQRIKFPQVVGYIAVGLIVGRTGLHLVNEQDIATLQPFSMFALGIIGFLVGGELKLQEFKKYGRQFAAILFGEGTLAFVLVTVFTSIVLSRVIPNPTLAIAGGIVLGAIASATDPASTIDVLWEYRTRGILTTSIIAIVALDDALAMTLYGLGSSMAGLLASGNTSIVGEATKLSIELLGALILGLLGAVVLGALIRWFRQPEKTLSLSIGLILLLIVIAVSLEMDVILAAMTLGCALTNMMPRESEAVFKVIRNFSNPIYVLFFVLVGARLGVGQMPLWLWGIVFVYVIGRSAGKVIGAYVGARATGSAPVVQRYLGMGIFAQGGVAVGLSIMASRHLSGIQVTETLNLGEVIIFTVTATTLIVQVVGPPLTKLAVKLAGEIGRNVTEEDVVATLKVRDVMKGDMRTIGESQPLSQVIPQFIQDDYMVYPVVDKNFRIAGMISIEGLKGALIEQDMWTWLVVSDVMAPAVDVALPDADLRETLAQMQSINIDQMPVVDRIEGGVPVGMLELRHIRKFIAEELLKRQGVAGAA